MNFKKFFSEQAGKPTGIFGRVIMSRIFEKGNADLNNFMKELLSPEETDNILEIGFGTGRLISDMAAITKQGIMEGVDLSETMVSIARKKNRKYMEEGRVKIRQGSFEEMSYRDIFFDKVCSANTIYFWSDPEDTAEKILKILKPGGKLVIGFGDKEQLKKKTLSSEVFRFYSHNEVKNILKNSGFTGGIDIMSKQGKSFILNCAVAVK
jgi:ubiquinone/menaquinone biosynthesis C-methylase UbiE